MGLNKVQRTNNLVVFAYIILFTVLLYQNNPLQKYQRGVKTGNIIKYGVPVLMFLAVAGIRIGLWVKDEKSDKNTDDGKNNKANYWTNMTYHIGLIIIMISLTVIHVMRNYSINKI